MTLWEWIELQAASANMAFKVVAALIVSVVLFVAVSRSGFSLVKIILGLLAGALAWWGIVGDGMEVFAGIFSRTAELTK